MSDADLAHLLALYDGEIRYADTEVGRVLDHLTARGLDRSTLVVITSDHGEEFLDHGSWEHQKTLYEEVVRVPLAIRGAGLEPRRVRAPVSALDGAPTSWLGGVPARPSRHRASLLGPLPEREAYGDRPHRGRTHKLPARGRLAVEDDPRPLRGWKRDARGGMV